MDIKDKILIATNIVGWTLAIVFFILKRKHDKKDRALEKRFEVYNAFLKKSDELNESLRTDPSAIYGMTTEYITEILASDGDEAVINKSLIKFNKEMLEYAKRSTQPLQIINFEINNLKLIASDELLKKIHLYQILAKDLNNELQKTLNTLSPSDSNQMTQQLQTLGQDKRSAQLEVLYQDMLTLMRKEIGFYKN